MLLCNRHNLLYKIHYSRNHMTSYNLCNKN